MTTAPLLHVDCWLVDVRGLSAAQTTAWDTATPEARERAAVLAAAALRFLTAGAVEPCAVVVRPCARSCTPLTWQTYPVGGVSGASGFAPSLRSGVWINTVCGCGAGRCGHDLTSLRLPEATDVVSVWVGGVQLDEADYTLRGDRLIRLDGGTWPRSQNLSAERTDPDTFEVTYHRRTPGHAGELAAGRLASEYLTLIGGGSCALPSTATQVQRAGVSITLAPGAFPDGVTGVREVDAWVQGINPNHLIAPSEVLSPDTIC